MRDILPEIERWRDNGDAIAVATVISMQGSAPRRPGAKLAVNQHGELTGSVSGGCVEPAGITSALEGIKTRKPPMLGFWISEKEDIEQIGRASAGGNPLAS